MRYVVDRYAGGTRGMVETSRTGAENIASHTGEPFATTETRWALANWVSDLPGFAPPAELLYDSWRFRATYASLHAQDPVTFPKPFPLTPTAGAGAAVSLSGTLRAGSGVYHRAVQRPGGAAFRLHFTAADGRPLDPAVVPRLNVIRIR